MIAHAYTADDARREVREIIEEEFGLDYIRIFLNDLARGKAITWEENREIMWEILMGDFGDIPKSYGTY